LPGHVTAGGGGDNRPALQRVVADMQLLQSKLHQFTTHLPAADQNPHANIGQNTRLVLTSDNTDSKLDELKQHYDAEVFL